MANDINTARTYTQSGDYGTLPVEAIVDAEFGGGLSLYWRELLQFGTRYQWDRMSSFQVMLEAAAVGPLYQAGRWTTGTAVKASIASPPSGQLATDDMWAGFALSRVADYTTLIYAGGQRVRFGGFPMMPAKDGSLGTLAAFACEYPGADGYPISLAGYQGGVLCVPLTQNGAAARTYLQNSQTERARFNLQAGEILLTLFPAFEVGRAYQRYLLDPPTTYLPTGTPTNLAPTLDIENGGDLLRITGTTTYALWLVLMRQPPLLKFDRCYAQLGMGGPVSAPIGPKDPPGGPKGIGDVGAYSTDKIRYVYGLTWEVDWAANCATSDSLFEISPASGNFGARLSYDGPGDKGPYRPEIGEQPYVSAFPGWMTLPG